MRFPSHLLRMSTFRSEPYMAALAVVAVSMFVGAWVIGPVITKNSSDVSPPVSQERPSVEAMNARPDPLPYRAATPAFDMSGPPNYGAIARERAQTQAGGVGFDGDDSLPAPSFTPSRSYRSYDRHRVH